MPMPVPQVFIKPLEDEPPVGEGYDEQQGTEWGENDRTPVEQLDEEPPIPPATVDTDEPDD